MSTQQPPIVVRDLGRSFRSDGGRRALAGVDLTVDRGEVHGLLGPNGAGKTTLCRVLSTVLLPTSGYALVDGHDVVTQTAAVRRLIGVVFGGERGLYARLTARQNLRFWAALYRVPRTRVDPLLDRVGLTERADERVQTYSRGMKQRLHLARGLIADPSVLILDEPTTGMDPVAAREFRVLVERLRAERRTVLLTTHDMAEAEALCDRVSILDGGRLIATEQPAAIGRWISRYEQVEAQAVPAAVAAGLEHLPGVAAVRSPRPGTVLVETSEEGAVAVVLRYLLDAGVSTVATTPPSLEQVYLRVIGDRGLRV
ncbi:daunorubicin resistance protein DrrA family ABC transporter ATP-binding protein [Saccharothrix violaceirubra]|uniref:ABC-2 type transport system ATP-binding protein n=1 Tax=Saccharothrix violaceirubra TaxID=413306 RepID=A0A7W7T360_9PSEU|nr:ABC transporter ATP-binding protein [Saccharothrix violaceirubra]MBB4965752.1 ABC-2 type transport system ATP-binding protein [Saccharothrix violaceirubra]